MRIASTRVARLLSLFVPLTAFAIFPVDAMSSGASTLLDTWENAPRNPREEQQSRYIVQAETVQAARERVQHVGGRMRQELPIIHSVSAALSDAQASLLGSRTDVHLFKDRPLATENDHGSDHGSKGSNPSPQQGNSSETPPLTSVVL